MDLSDLIPEYQKTIPYTYEVIACPDYEQLIAQFLDGHKTSPQPRFIHMSGIPGSGKSTFYHRHNWGDTLMLDFDRIMEEIPAYQQDLKKQGSAKAFSNWEIPARIIGYELLCRAVSLSINIFFDHGGIDPTHIDLMKNIKKYGYTTEMYHISCDFETAVRRTVARENLTHRHTPRELVTQRAALIDNFLNQYQKIIDTIYFYDSTSGDYILTGTSQQNLIKSA